jgi:hypothetical protein
MNNLEKAEELSEKNEFAMRSCWECNPAHEHLKKVGGLFVCYDCVRWFMNGDFLANENHCKKEFEEIPPLKTTTITINKK